MLCQELLLNGPLAMRSTARRHRPPLRLRGSLHGAREISLAMLSR